MKILENKFLRTNIVELKKNEYEFGRFVMALKNLEESEDWPRIAGIHGYVQMSQIVPICAILNIGFLI